MAKFLDDAGLSHFVSKIKEWLSDIYTKSEVDNLIKDPTANTMTSCVGYEDDILGGY